MRKRLLLGLMSVALVTASAATHRITFYQPSVISGTELKPGDYRLDVTDSKVVIRKGKETVEAQAKIETGDAKYSATSVRYVGGEGKQRVAEIRLGGTNTRLVFSN